MEMHLYSLGNTFDCMDAGNALGIGSGRALWVVRFVAVAVVLAMLFSGGSVGLFSADGVTSGHSTPVAGQNGSALVGVSSSLSMHAPPESVTAFAPSYVVSFQGIGLPTGGKWTVAFNGVNQSSTTQYDNFTVQNGSYLFNVTGGPKYYSPNPIQGDVNVSGSPQTVSITFTRFYTLWFNETGLPSGSSWSISIPGSLSNSVTSTIEVLERNGTYAWDLSSVPNGWRGNPASGSITVSGSNASITIAFVKVYNVTFSESGLSSGATWAVTLNGVKNTSGSSSIVFGMINGTYAFTVGAVPGYFSTPSKGNVTIAGATVSETITFTKNLTIFMIPSPGYVDVGRTLTFTNNTTGGSGGNVWTYSVNVSTGWSRSGNVFTFTVIGKYNVTLTVKDSDGHVAASSSNVTVSSDLTGVTVSGVPSVIDDGQNATLVTAVTGGTTPYHYAWYTITASGVVKYLPKETNSSFVFDASSFSTNVVTIGVRVMDNASTSPMTIYSTNYTVSIFPRLTAGISPTSGVTDVNTPIYFTATVSGGTGFYGYMWYVNGVAQGDNSTTFTFEVPSAGIYVVKFIATDTAVSSDTSPYPNIYGVNATLTVHSAISASISAVRVTIDQGQAVTITSSVTGGTGSYLYQWYMNGGPIGGATLGSYTFSPGSSISPGVCSFYLIVTDSIGNHVDSNNVTITVSPALTVSISSFPSSIASGQEANITSTIAGGSGGLAYQWYVEVPGSSVFVKNATTKNFQFKATAGVAFGTYSFYLNVSDSNGVVVKSNIVSIVVGKGYTVTFTETGLASGSSWTVEVDGVNYTSTTSTLSLTEPNVTYSYHVATPLSGSSGTRYVDFVPSGNFTVIGASIAVDVTFVVQYSVTVNVSPVGSGSISLADGWYNTTTKLSIQATPSGGYTFGEWQGTGSGAYSGTNNPANFWVNSSVTETAVFEKLYAVLVTETGLPSGSIWYFNISGLSFKTGGSVVSLDEPNGSYSYTVQTGLNYYASPSSGSVVVSGKTAYVNITFTNVLGISISPASGKTDVGIAIVFANVTNGGSGGYVWTYSVNVSSGFVRNGNSFVFDSPGSYLVTLKVVDNTGHTASVSAFVKVYSGMTVSVSGVPAVIDEGQTATFSAIVNGGSPSFTYEWYVDGNHVGGNVSVFTYAPSGTGLESVYLVVKDSASTYPVTVQSSMSNMTVFSRLLASVSPASGNTEVNAPIYFTGTAAGGTGFYSYGWEVNGVSQNDNTTSFVFKSSSTGIFNVTFFVTDTGVSAGTLPYPDVYRVSLSVTVHGVISVVISVTTSSLDQGQSVEITSSVSGGSIPYTYQWYMDYAAIPGATVSTYTFDPTSSTAPGLYYFYLYVSDSSGNYTASNNVTIRVYPSLSASIARFPSNVAAGNVAYVNSTVLGGSGGLAYQWYVEVPGSSSFVENSTSQNVVFATKASTSYGTYSYYLVVKDSDGVNVKSNVVSIVVGKGYSVIFQETGLPSGLKWYVTLNGVELNSTLLSVTFVEPNVTYPYSVVTPLNGSGGTRYVDFSPSGNITVDGSLVIVDVTFVTQYYVTVGANPSDGGAVSLVSGWYNSTERLSAEATPAIGFTFGGWTGSGSGAYTGAANPTFVWANSSVSEVAVFDKLYPIAVNETGLPGGLIWYFNISGLSFRSGGGSVSFYEPNGTYTYTVFTNASYYPSPSSGNVVIKGKAVYVNIIFTGNMFISISPVSVGTDIGIPVTFKNITLGGDGVYSWSYSVNVSAGYNRTGNSFNFTKSGSYMVTLKVSDTDGHTASATANVVVYPRPVISVSGVPSIMDDGQVADVHVTVSGGVSPFSFQWYVNGVAAGGDSVNFTFVPTGPGSYKIFVVVQDSAFTPVVVKSSISTVVASPSLVVSVSPPTGQVDAGLSITLTGSVSGGTGSYSVQWFVNGQGQSDSQDTFVFTPSSSGTYVVEFSVTDTGVSSGALPSPYMMNATSVISVHSAFTVTMSITHSRIDVGQYTNMTLSTDGGSGNFQYKWYMDGQLLTWSGSYYNFSASGSVGAGVYTFYVVLKDSTGAISNSSVVDVTVYPAMSVGAMVSGASVGAGQSVNVTSSVSGGEGPYSYQWFEKSQGASTYSSIGTSAYYNFSTAGLPTGNYSFYVVVKDRNNATSRSLSVSVYVGRGYTVTFNEVGLPKGTIWDVSFGGTVVGSNTSKGSAIKFIEPNVSFPYVVLSPIGGGSGVRYATSEGTGMVVVDGKNIEINITYSAQYFLQVVAAPSGAGAIYPGSGWYNASSSVTLSVSAGEFFYFSSWSGVGDGSYSGSAMNASVVMDGYIIETAHFVRAYTVSITETGLPYGTLWGVDLSGRSYNSSTISLSFEERNGTYAYTPFTLLVGYVAGSKTGTVTVAGQNVSVVVNFFEVTYSVYFNETGLPVNTSWDVVLNGRNVSTTGQSVFLGELNGSYDYTLSSVYISSGVRYVATEAQGVVVVSGRDVSVVIVFTLQYYLTLDVTGSGSLNTESGWYNASSAVRLIPTPSAGFAFIGWSGSGAGEYSGNLSAIQLTIKGPISEVGSFGKLFLVQISETGLTAGAEWYFNLSNGSSFNTTAQVLNCSLVNGSYNYSVSGGDTYVEGVGVFNVSGEPTVLAVVFSVKTFDVSVSVSGLPKGDSWTVTLHGTSAVGNAVSLTETSTGGVIEFTGVPMGKYTYSVSFPYGAGAVSSAPINVNTQGLAVKVTTPAVVKVLPYLVILGIVGTVGGVGGFFFLRLRRSRKPPKSPLDVGTNDRDSSTPPLQDKRIEQ